MDRVTPELKTLIRCFKKRLILEFNETLSLNRDKKKNNFAQGQKCQDMLASTYTRLQSKDLKSLAKKVEATYIWPFSLPNQVGERD